MRHWGTPAHWYAGTKTFPAMQAGLIPPGVFEAWADATWATDPDAAKQSPPMLRAPNGVVEDSMNYWVAGKAHSIEGSITTRLRSSFLGHSY
jgi:hypothetical protein